MFTPVVRVATWNLLFRPTQRMERLARLARSIGDVDVLALQEVSLDGSDGNIAERLAALAGFPHVHSADGGYVDPDTGERTGTAVLSRLPMLAAVDVPMPHQAVPPPDTGLVDPAGYAAATVETPNGRPLHVVSVHFPWGGHRESVRFAYAEALDAHAAGLPGAPLVVAAGDFNGLPESDTMRYLGGLARGEAGVGAYWLDAWATANPGDPGYTQDPRTGNWNIHHVAMSRGILDPSRLPPRRIDYVLVRGWAYGKPGHPLAARLLGAGESRGGSVPPSDHAGLVADLWDPS